MRKISKRVAQAAYRQAWRQRVLAPTLDGQKAAEYAMDALEDRCVRSKREWEKFIDTLPGFRELWAQMAAQCEF